MRRIVNAVDLQAYLFCCVRALSNALLMVESDVMSVVNWAAINNQLLLNIDKTKNHDSRLSETGSDYQSERS